VGSTSQRKRGRIPPLYLGIIFVLLAVILTLLILLERALSLQNHFLPSFLIGALILAVIYAVPTLIIFRNIKLHGFLKHLFSFTLTPLFVVLMCLNIVLTYKFVPGLFHWFQKLGALSRPADVSFLLRHIYFYGFGSLFMVVVFLIACSISIPLCYGWYRLLLRWDERRSKNTVENPLQ
jgi:hypothetical protein